MEWNKFSYLIYQSLFFKNNGIILDKQNGHMFRVCMESINSNVKEIRMVVALRLSNKWAPVKVGNMVQQNQYSFYVKHVTGVLPILINNGAIWLQGIICLQSYRPWDNSLYKSIKSKSKKGFISSLDFECQAI